MKTLIYDLLLTEAWKEKVYPLIKQQVAKTSSIRAYMAVSLNMLIIADISRGNNNKYSRMFLVSQDSNRIM